MYIKKYDGANTNVREYIVFTGFKEETGSVLKSSYCNGSNQCDIIHCLGVVTQTSLIKLRRRKLLGVKNICTAVYVEL